MMAEPTISTGQSGSSAKPSPELLSDNRIPQRLLTAAELAERLNIPRNKVYRLVAAGELPAIPVGGQWRFDWEDVVTHLKGKSHGVQGS